MRKTFGAALAALTLTPIPADATGIATAVGTTCGMFAVLEDAIAGQDTAEGVFYAAVTANDVTDPTRAVPVKVTCTVEVLTSVRGAKNKPGTRAVVLAEHVSFVVTRTDQVRVCTQVEVDGVPRPKTCAGATWAELPPQEVCVVGCPTTVDTVYVTPDPYAG
ncbi:MAG TPA: hypothetical protein VNA20_16955 [Frankiaceae bacterium]|nr:hypothetical protein [Frankiaceae bacterium]